MCNVSFIANTCFYLFYICGRKFQEALFFHGFIWEKVFEPHLRKKAGGGKRDLQQKAFPGGHPSKY